MKTVATDTMHLVVPGRKLVVNNNSAWYSGRSGTVVEIISHFLGPAIRITVPGGTYLQLIYYKFDFVDDIIPYTADQWSID